MEPRRKALGHRLKKEGGSRDLGGRASARLPGATCGRGRRRWRPTVHPKRGKGWGAGVSRRGAHVPGRLGDGSLPLGSSALLNPARLRRRRHRGGAPAGSGAGAAAGGTWGRLATGGRGGSRAGERRQAWDSLLLWLLGGEGLRGGQAGRGLRLRRGGERKPWDRLRLRLQLGDGARGGGAVRVAPAARSWASHSTRSAAGHAQCQLPRFQVSARHVPSKATTHGSSQLTRSC